MTSATLKLKLLSGQSTAHPIRAWRVTSSWTSSGLKWNNRPSCTDDAAAVADPKDMIDYSFQVADIVNKWYNGGTNYGFMLGYSSQSVQDLNSLYSVDCGISTCYPTLTFDYVSTPTLSSIANGVYFIRNQNSGKYIDVQGQYTYGGANIHQWSFHGGPSQQWKDYPKRWAMVHAGAAACAGDGDGCGQQQDRQLLFGKSGSSSC